jgi:cysteine synthase A
MFAATRGYGATFTMPDKVTKEKQNMMTLFGAKVVTVPPAPFSSPNHFYKRAKQMADESNKKLVFLDQFENKANFRAHFEGTGPEIWNALDGKLTSFVCAMGTGGTMSGCSAFLKQQNEKIKTAVMVRVLSSVII